MSLITSTPPARAEWDFSKCPVERLGFCRNYEIAREIMLHDSPAFLRLFENEKKADVKKKAKGPKKEDEAVWVDKNRGFDQYGTWHYLLQGAENEKGYVFAEQIDAPAGFPYEPYLKLTHHVTPRSFHPFSPERGIQPWRVVQEVHYNEGRFFKAGIEQEVDPDFEDTAMFIINLNYSPHQIATVLKDWVYRRHPGKFFDRRGKNLTKQLRYDLAALGAWRLIKALGSAAAASNHTADFSDDCKGLFKQPSGWTDAQKRIREILADWKQALADSGLK